MYRERHKSAPLKTSAQDLRQWGGMTEKSVLISIRKKLIVKNN